MSALTVSTGHIPVLSSIVSKQSLRRPTVLPTKRVKRYFACTFDHHACLVHDAPLTGTTHREASHSVSFSRPLSSRQPERLILAILTRLVAALRSSCKPTVYHSRRQSRAPAFSHIPIFTLLHFRPLSTLPVFVSCSGRQALRQCRDASRCSWPFSGNFLIRLPQPYPPIPDLAGNNMDPGIDFSYFSSAPMPYTFFGLPPTPQSQTPRADDYKNFHNGNNNVSSAPPEALGGP